jgi:hypothetical protein
MYITADGTESILSDDEKVESWDVKKVGTIITSDVPTGGRWVLKKYFEKVEREIAAEVAARRTDIANIRTKMAKNRAYNEKARATMRKELLHRMAVNAKQAKDDLDAAMHKVAKQFAEVRATENQRNRETRARSRKTREIMKKNKKENAHNLHMAVLNQQRALAALDSATNEKIHQTQKNIAINGAQIKTNALKARKDLDEAMSNFDKKMFQVTAEAKKARNGLSVLARQMDKKVRAHVTSEVKSQAAMAAKEFQDVRSTMAKDRHHADMMLAQASLKMKVALAAQSAIEDSRFKKTVNDIAQAKKEADEQVDKMKKDFKVQILSLESTVTEQVQKLNGRVTQLSGVVTNNKLEQARVNTNVNAEILRMIKVGKSRETKLAAKDKALRGIMEKNREANNKAMDGMAKKFYAALKEIRKEMAHDRKYQEGRLKKATQGLYSTLAKNKEAQDAVNKQLTAATKAAEDEAARNLKEAKRSFATRLGALSTTVKKNEKKANKKIEKLTGVVAANALTDLNGRKQLRILANANKLNLKSAIRGAIEKGEKRAKQVEKLAKDMNKKTRDALNARISTEIGTLTKQIHSDIEGLQLQSAEARKEMKKEVLAGLRDEEELMKKNIKNVVLWANKEFRGLDERLEKEKTTSAAGRKVLKESIDKEKEIANRALADAVLAQAKALMALKIETQKKIKKTNGRVDAYGKRIEEHAKAVAAQMAANDKVLEDKLTSLVKTTKKAESKAEAASQERARAAIKQIKDGLAAAKKKTDKKFKDNWVQMGKDRANADQALAAATKKLNDALAKHAALETKNFEKSVADIEKAREDAKAQVEAAKKFYTTSLVEVTASAKKAETRVVGQIQIVANMIIEETAAQARVNKEVKKEIARITKLSNDDWSHSIRARGKIREVMNANKLIAQEEVKALEKKTTEEYKKLRSYQAKLRRQAAEDLTKATTRVYEKLSADQLRQENANKEMTATLAIKKASSAEALKKIKGEFKERFTTLTNTVTANHKSYEEGLKKITKVQYDWEKSSSADRVLLRKEAKTMGDDLNKAIVKAIQKGEARAKEVLETSLANVDAEKRALQIEIGEQVEAMADTVLKTVNGDRKTIANNYLSVKGYAGAAQDDIMDYVQKGKGKGLSAIGDFLQSVAVVSAIKTKAAEGVSAGSGKIQPAFGGSIIREVKSLSKVNGLVNEYSQVYNQVKMRWPYGLGNYLLGRLAAAMAKDGILQVGNKGNSAGKFVHVNAKALGLSHQMEAFKTLGCRLTHYQNFLSKLAAKLPKTLVVKPLEIPPPEWQGD